MNTQSAFGESLSNRLPDCPTARLSFLAATMRLFLCHKWMVYGTVERRNPESDPQCERRQGQEGDQRYGKGNRGQQDEGCGVPERNANAGSAGPDEFRALQGAICLHQGRKRLHHPE